MTYLFTALRGLAAGAAAMYLLDPEQGPRRRAELRDKLVAFASEAQHAAGAQLRDASNRGLGLLALARSAFGSADADDKTLAARVRSKLGRAGPRLRGVRTAVRDGNVTLRGAVAAKTDAERLREAAREVPGVHAVRSRLEVRPGRKPGSTKPATTAKRRGRSSRKQRAT